MKLPLSYSFRNLWTRKITTFLTISGMALVVYVFAAVLMLSEGLKKTLQDTGSMGNAIIVRRSADAEVMSIIQRREAAIIETLPEIALDQKGDPLFSREVTVLVALPKTETGRVGQVTIRGVSEKSLELRNHVILKSGRYFKPGPSEIVIGSSIAKRFKGTGLGQTIRFGLRDWLVVGILDAQQTGFDSEIWADVDQVMNTFHRPVYSSMVLRLRDDGSFQSLKKHIESDPRLTVTVKREAQFYVDQSEMMAKFIRILGLSITIIFSVGAMIGAMVTMYAAVANRTVEIGTLRALGFPRKSILAAFLIESLLLGVLGGILGLGSASLMQWVSISTMNWQTFSELAFNFILNSEIAGQTFAFALIMGLLGGFLPALRASRLNIVEALRTT
ncbi:MAG: ABC transporter permease [Deltaproteobacteria bacterium]|nr:ABC transporter permease [Deltaproteobacteria bacterium]